MINKTNKYNYTKKINNGSNTQNLTRNSQNELE